MMFTGRELYAMCVPEMNADWPLRGSGIERVLVCPCGSCLRIRWGADEAVHLGADKTGKGSILCGKDEDAGKYLERLIICTHLRQRIDEAWKARADYLKKLAEYRRTHPPVFYGFTEQETNDIVKGWAAKTERAMLRGLWQSLELIS